MMARPYLCPACRNNHERFEVIYKLVQEVRLDANTGELLFETDELTTLIDFDGRPDIDVRCGRCSYTGKERSFLQAAKREASI